MARNDEGYGLITGIVLIIYIIYQTFTGNFIPILIVAGIFLVFKIFIWWTELTPKNKQEANEPKKEINYSSYLLIFLILGGTFAHIYFKNNHQDSTAESVPSYVYPVPQTVVVKSEAKELPKEILWISENSGNSEFSLPENMIFRESLSTSQGKVYIDEKQNLSLTITWNSLDEESKNKTIDDFKNNLKTFAESFNENNRRNFDDFKLEHYEIASFGNVRAIKIQQTSTKVSGKNIEMLVTSYEIIANPYYYDITVSYPKDSIKFINTFEKIDKSFLFKILNNDSQVQTEASINFRSGNYIVSNNESEKIYFYDKPDENFIRKAYLVGGENVYVEKVSDGFGYIEFRNSRGLITKGWIKLKHLSNND
jgi:hypothetical protein